MTVVDGWAHARNVLCVRLDSVGDVLMTQPALRALRESLSRRRLTLLTSAAGAKAAPLVAEVDDVIVHDAPWTTHAASDDVEALVRKLRHRCFDAAVIFTPYSQSPLPAALVCRMAGIPLVLGHCREDPYSLLSDWVPEHEPEDGLRHEVRRQLDLVGAVGALTQDERLRLRMFPRPRVAAVRLLSEVSPPWALLHPGAPAASRRYPPELWARAASLLARDGWTIVLTGAAEEDELVSSVEAAIDGPTLSLAAELTLPQLAAVIEQASVLLCGNTWPAHLAAAVATPVVDVYALTHPHHTPWMVPSRVLFHAVECSGSVCCGEGHHDCVRFVAPEDVAAAARDLAREPMVIAQRGTGDGQASVVARWTTSARVEQSQDTSATAPSAAAT